MFTKSVLIDGYNIDNHVTAIQSSLAEKPQWGQMQISRQISVQCENSTRLFSPTNQFSILRQKVYSDYTVTIRDKASDRDLWTGVLSNVTTADGGETATLVCDPILQTIINSPGYFSLPENSPAELARQMLMLLNIPVDDYSFGNAHYTLTQYGVRVRMAPSLIEWSGTLADVLQMIASASCGRFYYTTRGKVGFDVFDRDLYSRQTAITKHHAEFNNYSYPPPGYKITDEDITSSPQIDVEASTRQTGYRVTYMHGFVSFNEGTGAVTSFDFGPASPIQMLDAVSATFCGEQWLAMSRRQFMVTTFTIVSPRAAYIQLGDWLRIESARFGISDRGEVVGIDNLDSLDSRITIRSDLPSSQ